MTDRSQGEGWWLASDGKWYPPESHPAAHAPPPPQAPGSAYGTAPKTNGLAIASLVLGIVWVWWIGSLLAIIFGHRARSQIDGSGGAETGRGMATAGLVLGYLGLGFLILGIVAIVGAAASFDTTL